jgi:sortase A
VGIFDGLPSIGTRGNAVLGGHSEQARGVADVFFNLHQVQVGDEVLVTTGGDPLRYQVVSVRSVNFRDLSILHDAGDERLTIITCDRSTYTAGGYAGRVVVVARRVG